MGNPLVRLCVQQRLVCSAGVSPAGVRIRNSVTWMADMRETEYLKPIDKAILGVVSELSGRNESERIGGLENAKPLRQSLQPKGECSMNSRNLIVLLFTQAGW